MATRTLAQLRVGYTISGNSPEIRVAVEGASQTHTKGLPLFLTATALRAVPTTEFSQADLVRGIAGIAQIDGGNYTNSTTEVEYVVANDDTVFLGNVISRESAATATLAHRYIGSVCGASNTASRFYVNVKMTAATNSLLIPRGFYESDNSGDTYGRVYFQFLRASRAFQ